MIKVIFFDIRDTLGEVDRPGHLQLYKPSTQKLLEAMKSVVGLQIGVISNLPDDLTAEQGRKMVADAGLMDFISPNGIVFNHDANVSKPDPEIFRYAAKQMGVGVEECIFSGENLNEVLGALAAGMHSVLKPCPPGREFTPPPVQKRPVTPTDSGRAFEAFLEHEHLLGDRIFHCGRMIVAAIKDLKQTSDIPKNVQDAMGVYVYLTNNFADQAHFAAEEAAIPLAIARGMDPKEGQWVLDQHTQARAYFRGFDIAYKRILAGDNAAISDFWRTVEAFVILFELHAVRENDELYPAMGRVLTDADDSLLMNILQQVGPRDFTPYVGLVARMEELLGIPHPEE